MIGPSTTWAEFLIGACLALTAFAGAWSLARGFGWGPGTHVRLARRLSEHFAGRAARSEASELLLAHPGCFLYGNIAADIVNFKGYGGVKNHCHHWSIHERLEEHARDERDRAFILGYLCHLAADLVAHNHMVPYHLVRGLPPRLLAHAYWEALADGGVAEEDWEALAALKRDRTLHRHDRLVWAAVPRRAFGRRPNKWIFHQFTLVSLRPSWRELIRGALRRRARHPIDQGFLRHCVEASYRNMLQVFDTDRFPLLKAGDPTGRAALRHARVLRREIARRHGYAEAGRRASERLAREAYWALPAPGPAPRPTPAPAQVPDPRPDPAAFRRT